MMQYRSLVIVAAVLVAGCSSAPSLTPSIAPASAPIASPAAASPSLCPSGESVDVLAVINLLPADRLSCFGSRTVSFKAWVLVPIAGGANREVFLQTMEGEAGSSAFLDGLLDPALGSPQLYRWFNVTGHFRDPATACPSGTPDVGEPLCDALYFVVTGLEPTTGP